MKTVKIRDLILGGGRPKICVPIVGKTESEILTEAEKIADIYNKGADLCEWRVDWYESVFSYEKLEETAAKLRKILGSMAILATFRTYGEGGVKPCATAEYAELVRKMCAIQQVDTIDIELFTGDVLVRELVEEAHHNGKAVIMSSHDFHKTPEKAEIRARLSCMEALGADILKIAVMPESPADVITLLDATVSMRATLQAPIITMSMGSLGMVSRISGSLTGSCLTFGSMSQASAPGQIPAEELMKILNTLGVS